MTDEQQAPDDQQDGDGLGDKGKQALDRMKAERNDAQREAAAWKALGLTVEQIRDLQAKAGQAPAGDQPDPDQIRYKAVEDAEKAATARFEAQARRTAVREQARALGFHNAADALAEIRSDDLAAIAVLDDEADADAIAELVKKVAEKKPYLVKSRDSSAGDAGIGGVGNSDRPAPRTAAERIARAYADNSRTK